MAYKAGRSAAGGVVELAARLVPASLPVPYPFDDVFWMAFRKPAAGPA